MTDDRLTQDERTVLSALRGYCEGRSSWTELKLAYSAYKASITPQPVRCLMTRRPGEPTNPNGWESAWRSVDEAIGDEPDEVWRVTITPIERVR